METKELKRKANDLRLKILDICVRAGTGHLSSAFSATDILVSLFHTGVLRHDPKKPDWPDRDIFLLSKGHAAPLLYAVLADRGFIPLNDLELFVTGNGIYGSHVQKEVPGAEISSGSLGHGPGIGAGFAHAAKLDDRDRMVYTLVGDGECYEGSIWESAMFAAHYGLDNLVCIVDRNNISCLNCTQNIIKLEPFKDKWESFGWDTYEVDGHDIGALTRLFNEIKAKKNGRPAVVIANTVKGKGISFIEGQIFWHGVIPKGEEVEKARKELEAIGRSLA